MKSKVFFYFSKIANSFKQNRSSYISSVIFLGCFHDQCPCESGVDDRQLELVHVCHFRRQLPVGDGQFLLQVNLVAAVKSFALNQYHQKSLIPELQIGSQNSVLSRSGFRYPNWKIGGSDWFYHWNQLKTNQRFKKPARLTATGSWLVAAKRRIVKQVVRRRRPEVGDCHHFVFGWRRFLVAAGVDDEHL